MKESNHDMFFGSWYNLQDGSGIYAIVNSLDNKKYIGSTGTLRKRFRQHYAALVKGTHANCHLQRAVNKYGIDKFYFLVLEGCENITDTLLLLEQKYIDELGDYNICTVAGKPIGCTAKGHPLSESQRNSIIKANKNRIWTEEMKRKKGLSAKNSNYIKSLQKIVQKYSLDGNLIEEYPSVMDAARAVGNPKISRVGIKRCYQGRQKSAYGYIWKLKIQEND